MARWTGRRFGGPPHPLAEEAAQGTVEYALTVVALLAVATGLAAIWRAGQTGALARLVELAASHALAGLGALDIALY